MVRGRTLVGIVIILVLGMTLPTFAQEYRGRVQGTITDQTNAVIVGAKVVLHNDGTGVDVTRTSDALGHFLFDYVDPAAYTLTVEMANFKTAVQKNIVVQQRGDVTVDMKMELGSRAEVITVTETPVAVQFNTATHDLTIETAMVRTLPSSTRNPLQLARLDPTIINRGSAIELQPYYHRTANEMDIGGGTKYRNDFVLDGTPLVAGNKLGYTPPMDAITEYTVQQNAVDAEFGHNAGGVAIVTMKSGTNELHGSAYYYRQDPGLNALSDRTSGIHNKNPFWNAGGTVGFPIIKKKLFFFGAFDKILNTQAVSGTYTLPTLLERAGDFSQSFNNNGTLRTIYDPMTQPLNNANRTAFTENKITPDRFDPLGKRILDNLWMPNCTPQTVAVGGNNFTQCGDDLSGSNNFKYTEGRKFHYYNFSTRLDYQINDKWKAFGRVSRIKTDQDANDYTNGNDPMKLRNVTGSKRNGWNIAGDTVYTLNATTVLDARAAFYKVEDKRDYPAMAIGDYSEFWSGQDGTTRWWESYMAGRPLVYAPNLVVDSTARGNFGVSNFWYQEPQGYSLHGRLTKYLTRHALKMGGEIRWKRGQAARFRFGQFGFTAAYTGNRYTSPSSSTGSPWASFLLGYMDSRTTGATLSQATFTPMQTANTEMYAGYVQDDIKLRHDVTINLGLRYEYEGGWWDPDHMIQKYLDLTDPIPGLQSAIEPGLGTGVYWVCPTPGQTSCAGQELFIPTLMDQSAGATSHIYNGAFNFTSADSTRGTHAYRWQFMPRIGVAWRLGDKMVGRFGYGRFYTPNSLIMPDRDANGELPLGAFTPVTNLLPEVAPDSTHGPVPQARFSDPFPQGLTPAYGKSYGRYTLLGDAVTFDQYNQRTPVSDRLTFSFQRELPFKIVADVTYLMNFVSHDQWTQQLNIADPRLSYTYKANLNKTVANPFLNYGTVDTFPGPLRNRPTVTIASLLVPYPQYGAILQTASDLRKSRYRSLSLRAQRPFTNGLSLLATYAWVTERTQGYFDLQDEYDGILTWFDGGFSPPGGTGTNLAYTIDPKHYFNAAVTYALPFGQGKLIGSGMSKTFDYIVGGWNLAGIYSYSAGQKLNFQGGTGVMVAPETVNKLGGIGRDAYWFDVTGFDDPIAYTRRTNPWYYDNLVGPGFKNLDMSVYKQFKVREGMNIEARLETFNALNTMNYANPILDITKADFGRVLTQAAGYYGRQLQYSFRFTF